MAERLRNMNGTDERILSLADSDMKSSNLFDSVNSSDARPWVYVLRGRFVEHRKVEILPGK